LWSYTFFLIRRNGHLFFLSSPPFYPFVPFDFRFLSLLSCFSFSCLFHFGSSGGDIVSDPFGWCLDSRSFCPRPPIVAFFSFNLLGLRDCPVAWEAPPPFLCAGSFFFRPTLVAFPLILTPGQFFRVQTATTRPFRCPLFLFSFRGT